MTESVLRSTGITAVLLIAAGAAAVTGCSGNRSVPSPEMQAKIDSLGALVRSMGADEATLGKNLQTFDTLDYTVFSNQEWIRLHESHSEDIIVNWPDGHHTNGIAKH